MCRSRVSHRQEKVKIYFHLLSPSVLVDFSTSSVESTMPQFLPCTVLSLVRAPSRSILPDLRR